MPIHFSLNYNQNDVLFRTIRRYIRVIRARSLLDIGAGDGALARRLGKLVPVYVAIERNPSRVATLRRAGVRTIRGMFPVSIEGTFDIVLSSHSLPEQLMLYGRFFKEAWRRVKPGGILLVITFKGTNDELKNINPGAWKKDREMYARMIRELKSFGRVRTEKATSQLSSRNIDTVVGVLSLMTGASSRGREYELTQMLARRFRGARGYYFPTNKRPVIRHL